MIMFIVATAIAGCAAFFSVKGIGLLFAGSFLSVVIMASCLEAGKLVAASFLYRCWHQLSWWVKTYLTAATLLLMIVTSLGIFGFLSDAYEHTKTKVEMLDNSIARLQEENSIIDQQISSIKTTSADTNQQSDQSIDHYKEIYDKFAVDQQNKLDVIKNQLGVMGDELLALQQQPGGLFSSKDEKITKLKLEQKPIRDSLNAQLSKIDADTQQKYNEFLAKVDSIQSFVNQQQLLDDRLAPLYDKIKDNDSQIMEQKLQISETDIGSFRFIARAFDVETDTAVKWFMLMIVVVFDPLAVCLVIGYNVLVMKQSDKSDDTASKWWTSGLNGWFHRGKSVVDRPGENVIRAIHRPK